ncbi:hypothetical protein D3C78_1424950 [compost metagenome]
MTSGNLGLRTVPVSAMPRSFPWAMKPSGETTSTQPMGSKPDTMSVSSAGAVL